jgi:CubicO group peptidase (beta-lactamase class C family)
MEADWDTLDAAAIQTSFSGVVRVDVGDATVWQRAYGLAHRGLGIVNAVDTRFGTASATKSMTALVVMRLVLDGGLRLDTRARELLGSDLPLIDDAVTVEHLLSHHSGIGDYLDEDAGTDVNDHVLTVPVHLLATTEDYLRVLDGFPQAFAPGERFAYCNGGYVVLALLAERAAGSTLDELVERFVCSPAGMRETAFLRSDESHATAVGYLDAAGLRTNILHLPVRGSGDGGLSSTVGDVHRFWQALWDGRIVPLDVVAQMVRPRGATPSGAHRYGLGFWLGGHDDSVQLEGMDAGVSFRSVHDPVRRYTYTVVSNTTDGAWPICRALGDLVAS